MRARYLLLIVLLAGMVFPSFPPLAVAGDRAVKVTPLDYNEDWYGDLAIGVPGEAIGAVTSAGAVNTLYGASSGLTTLHNKLWAQGSDGLTDAAEALDQFGWVLAAGDLNGDGYQDLAVGVMEDVGTAVNAGAVHVIYGRAAGLSAAGNQLWHQGSPGMDGAAESSDWFGQALAVGDFNGDGCGDLAVGVPGEDVGSVNDAGAVQIIYGAPAGLAAAGNQLWDQDSAGLLGMVEVGDSFGSALAAGDFDADGYADLAVGVPWEDVGSPAIVDAGAVQILYGSSAGLRAVDNQLWQQDSTGLADSAEANDHFGQDLAAGDFNGDGHADLAVGISLEDVGSPAVVDAGAVQVLYGGNSGLSASGSQFWHQNITGMVGTIETSDLFGSALAAGDFDGDNHVDLAIGVVGEDVGSPAIPQAGAVQIIYGGSTGLHAAGNQLWSQDSSGIVDSAEDNDYFGSALAAGDFDGDGYLDLAVGIPLEDVGSPAVMDAGAVQVIYGGSAGLSAAGNQYWHQGVSGIEGSPEASDHFGAALAAVPYATHRLHLPLTIRE